MIRSVPLPSLRTNFRSFLLFGTSVHALIFTALKSQAAKESKSTYSSNKGSTSIFVSSRTLTFFGDTSAFLSAPTGFMVGKRIISRMLGASVISMMTLSMPMPSPPVGGRPTSSALTKSISIGCASSSSPASSCACCSAKRLYWSIGSFSSEKPLQISQPLI